MRLSIETYPGIRRSSVILPSALAGHGSVVAWFVLTRFPYDRIGLAAGFILHIIWLYGCYVYAERNMRRRIAIVPFGCVDQLRDIGGVDWLAMKRPHLGDTRGCQAMVADFGADLPDEWEAFLADAALAGRMVYQVKQLAELLTGRVELEQSVRKQLRLAASRPRLFLPEGSRRLHCRAGDPAPGLAVHGS